MITKNQAIDLLKPYWEDPSQRGISDEGACMNLTPEGKQCVVGRQLKREIAEQHPRAGVYLLCDLLSGAFDDRPSPRRPMTTLRGFLKDDEKYGEITPEEWHALQCTHDEGLLDELHEIFNPSDIAEIAEALGGMEIPRGAS